MHDLARSLFGVSACHLRCAITGAAAGLNGGRHLGLVDRFALRGASQEAALRQTGSLRYAG